MSLGRYEGKGKVFVQGRLQAEANSATVRSISNNQKVYTMHKGLAGKSDGPPEVEITLRQAVPIAGFETDFFGALEDHALLEVIVANGGQRRRYVCWTDTVEDSYAVNASGEISTTLVGKPSGSGPGGLVSAVAGAVGL